MMPAFFLAAVDSESVDGLYRDMIDNGVDLVADIRLPRGFDLEKALHDLNRQYGGHVEYQWLKYFGNPHYDRDDRYESYVGYLVGMDKELEELYDLIMRRRVCIVDEEKAHERSYRLAIAEALKKKYGVAYADFTMAKDIIDKYGPEYKEA